MSLVVSCVILVTRVWLIDFGGDLLCCAFFLREFWLCKCGVRFCCLHKFGCAILVAGFWLGFCHLVV